MLTVILKFLEVGSRAVFVVFTTYSLGLAEAGQFGLLVTLQGFASFVFGYERQIDIQRRVVGQSERLFDQAVTRALALFAANYLWGIPAFVLALSLMARLSPLLILLCILIAVAEQLMNLAYHMSIVNPRYRMMLFVTVIKNVVIALGILAAGLVYTDLSLDLVLKIWAAVSVLGLLVIVAFWFSVREPAPSNDEARAAGVPPWTLTGSLKRQYRASWMHFLLGLTAVLTLQGDRLLVGALVSLEDAGIFFRHVLLVSMMYQVFNIAFHNRILPNVFLQGRQGDPRILRPLVRREYWNVLAFWALSLVAGVALDAVTGGALTERFHLVMGYFGGLLLMSALRTRADLNALVFNALHQEKLVFLMQLASFLVGVPVMVALTYAFGLPGIIAAGAFNALLYLTLTTLRLNRMILEKTHAA